MSDGQDRYFRERARIEQGHTRYRDKLRAEGKLFVRERLKLLLDPGSEFQEDWLFARAEEAETPADGVVTGVGRVAGRTVCIMANDYTVKAGSWGAKTVQKIIRIQEKAARLQVPLLYLVDAAGAPHLRADRDLPRALPRGPDLLQRGPAVRRGAPGVRPLRPLAGGFGVPAGADRRRHHGRRQGLALRGQPAHGRDGDRREDARWKTWAAPACTAPSPGAATCWPPPTRRPSSWPSRYLSYMPQSYRETAGRAATAAEPAAGALDRRHRALRSAQVLRHVRGHRSARRRRLLVRDQAALRGARSSRASPAWAAAWSASWPISPR